MSTDMRDRRVARRIAELYATNQQFADTRPSEAFTAPIEQPGLRLPQIVRTVMEGYADRPPLGQRAVQFVTDPKTGRTSLELLRRREMVTYRELWDHAAAIRSALTNPARSVLTGHTPAWLVVFDYRREAVETARARLVEAGRRAE